MQIEKSRKKDSRFKRLFYTNYFSNKLFYKIAIFFSVLLITLAYHFLIHRYLWNMGYWAQIMIAGIIYLRTADKRRNITSICIAALFMPSVDIFLRLMQQRSHMMDAYILGCLLILLYTMVDASVYDKTIKRFIYYNTYLPKRLAIMFIFESMIALAVMFWNSSYVMNQSLFSKSVSWTEIEKHSLDNHMDEILFLSPENWVKIRDDQQELDKLIQTIIKIETRYLGNGNGYPGLDYFTDESNTETTTAAYYDMFGDKIFVSTNLMDQCALAQDGYYLLEVICHELYHRYEQQQTELLLRIEEDPSYKKFKHLRLFADARRWRDNYNNYISGKDNYWEYYVQAVEKDSREYAEQCVIDYRNRIEEYIGTLEE